MIRAMAILTLACVSLAADGSTNTVGRARTTKEPVEVRCPVCEHNFTGYVANSTNTYGGQDRDYLQHAAGAQVFLFALWTCPKCSYSGYKSDFDTSPPEHVRSAILKEKALKPADSISSDINDYESIPAWVRYDLYIQVLKLRRDVDTLKLAWTHLRAAQTQRFNPRPLSVPELAQKRLRILGEKNVSTKDPYLRNVRVAQALEHFATHSKGSRWDRNIALLMAAHLYKTRGEDADATSVLTKLPPEEDLDAGMREDLEHIRNRIARETRYIRGALPLFKKALKDEVPEEEKPNYRYLIGELYRHCGDNTRAVEYLKPLADDADLPDWIRDWSREALTKAKGV